MTTVSGRLEHELSSIRYLADSLEVLADGIEFGRYKGRSRANVIRAVADTHRREYEVLMQMNEELLGMKP